MALASWRAGGLASWRSGVLAAAMVAPGAHESVYGSMPTRGLAAATSVRPRDRTATARDRLALAGGPTLG